MEREGTLAGELRVVKIQPVNFGGSAQQGATTRAPLGRLNNFNDVIAAVRQNNHLARATLAPVRIVLFRQLICAPSRPSAIRIYFTARASRTHYFAGEIVDPRLTLHFANSKCNEVVGTSGINAARPLSRNSRVLH